MIITTHLARITGPIAYRATSGRKMNIPMGPCLVESNDQHCIAIIWGRQGQRSVALSLAEAKAAYDQGYLVLLTE